MDSASHAYPTLPNAPLPAISSRPTLKHRFEGHLDEIYSFAFLQDKVHIVSGSLDGTMYKWDCNTGLLAGEAWKGAGGAIWALALSPDGRTIACGREDGSVQRWNTNGKMIEHVWTGHSRNVRSLSWSPGGSHLASGSEDGTILIRKAKSGEVAVGPIKTDQRWVMNLAYSPSGERIASGGDKNICIWDSNTGKLLVGPIEDLGSIVTSAVWSSDGSKLYSASDKFARVFDSVSGTLLHRFKHDSLLYSVALSPKHNVLACVGRIAQLWDTESYQPLSQSFRQDDGDTWNHFVSFSPDGQYLACGGSDNEVTLWMVQDIAPQFVYASTAKHPDGDVQEDTRPESPSSSCLDVDATKSVDDLTDEDYGDPYSCNESYQSSHTSLPMPLGDPSQKRRLWSKSILSKARLKYARHTSNSKPTKPEPQGKVKVRAEREHEEHSVDVESLDYSAHIMSAKQDNDKGKQREGPLADDETHSHDSSTSPAEFDTNQTHALRRIFIRARGNMAKKAALSTRHPLPEVVEVCAARGFERLVARKRKDNTKSMTVTIGASTVAAHASGSSQAGASSHGDLALMHASSHAQIGSLSQPIAGYGGQFSQASEGLTNHHTNDFSDSDSSIEGALNKFLDWICFPRGHFDI